MTLGLGKERRRETYALLNVAQRRACSCLPSCPSLLPSSSGFTFVALLGALQVTLQTPGRACWRRCCSLVRLGHLRAYSRPAPRAWRRTSLLCVPLLCSPRHCPSSPRVCSGFSFNIGRSLWGRTLHAEGSVLWLAVEVIEYREIKNQNINTKHIDSVDSEVRLIISWTWVLGISISVSLGNWLNSL